MNFDTAATRTASLIVAFAACLSGCGGGGNGGDPVATTQSADSSLPSATAQGDSSADHSTAVASAGDTTTTDTAAAAATPVTSTTTSTAPDAGSAMVSTSGSGASVAPVGATVDTTTTTQSANPDAQALAVVVLNNTPPTTTTSTPPTTTTTTTTTTTSKRAGVGTNLAGVFSYSAELPTIDLMKKASAWLTQCTDTVTCVNFTAPASGFETLEESRLDLDADGWVRSLPAANDTNVKYRMVTTKVAEGGVQQPGTYTVLYDGKGTISYLGAATKVASQSTAGRDVVSVVASATPFYLRISATDPTNYIRNIRVFPPGGACANTMDVYAATAAACTSTTGKFVAFENFPAGFTWHPAMLASLKGFRTLRFMDWGLTNATQVANWANRAPSTVRSWTNPQGVPVEQMFDLSAKVGADPWMNIPPHATDDYVHQFGKLAHAKLAAGQTLHLEYGNEMWNYAFPATKWGIAQSQTAYAPQLAKGANATVIYLNWYAQRLAQVCTIVKGEFGADASRVRCIANTQAGNWGNTDNVLQCIYAQPSLGKPCYKIFDAVAIAPYFGYYIGSGTTAPAVSAWTANTDGGLNQLFQEINGIGINGLSAVAPLVALGGKSSTGSVAEVNTWMINTKAVLAKYNLPMLAYEGGQGLIPPADTKVMNLMFAANRDPRMGTAYQALLADWKAAGGETFMYFSDVGTYTKSGMWGMRETMFDESNPKWKSAVNWRDNVGCWWAGC